MSDAVYAAREKPVTGLAFPLRPYQIDLRDGARAEMRMNRRVLVQAPTGSGKTRIFSDICARAAARGKRVIITAHRAEICRQISRALIDLGVPHGMIKPGVAPTAHSVQIAMIQTLARRLDRIEEPDLLIIDEAHHAICGQYRKVADRWTKMKVLGVTATPERLDGKGLKDAFDVMVPGPTIPDLIAAGYLADYDYLAPVSRVDLSGIDTRAGDYDAGQLAKAMDKPFITGDAIEHYRIHLDGKPAVAFCITVAHAEHVAEQFRAAGYRAASIDGKMKPDQRRELIAMLTDGRLQVLTSCELINEGVDVPVCAGAILLRPTKSLALHLQQVGRVLRPKPDDSRAVILDHVGNVHLHGLPTSPRNWSLDGAKKRAPAPAVTTCSLCFKTLAAAGAKAACAGCPGVGGEACPIAPGPESKAPTPPETIEGNLERVVEDPLAWTGGIPIERASGPEYRALLARAGSDFGRLCQIAKARGCRRGWIQHQMRAAQELAATRVSA